MIRRWDTAAACLALVVGLLAGCSGAPQTSADATTARLQQTVVAVAQHAAASEPMEALASLDELESQVTQDLADGEISPERAAAIRQSIGVVRADLAVSAQPTPTPTPVHTPAPSTSTSTSTSTGGGGDDNSGRGNNNGDNGNGNGNGKGKGKGNGKP